MQPYRPGNKEQSGIPGWNEHGNEKHEPGLDDELRTLTSQQFVRFMTGIRNIAFMCVRARSQKLVKNTVGLRPESSKVQDFCLTVAV